MLQEEIYDELMDKNGGHDWIDKQVTKTYIILWEEQSSLCSGM